MPTVERNREINNELSKLYLESSDLLIKLWKEATKENAPERINEFGMILRKTVCRRDIISESILKCGTTSEDGIA